MSADLLRQLLALDLSTEQALAVMDIIENRDGDRKEKARVRWHKWNDKRLPNVSKREPTLANVSSPTHASASPAPDLENKQTNKEDKKTRTPRDELAVVLDADRVDAVIEHRIKLRKPLTAYAARQLAASFASCPDANAAADLMIESGWLKIKPDWIASRSRQNSHGPPPGKRMSPVEAYQCLHSEPFHEPSSAPGTNGDVEFLRPDRPGLPAPSGNIRYRPREPDERSNH